MSDYKGPERRDNTPMVVEPIGRLHTRVTLPLALAFLVQAVTVGWVVQGKAPQKDE